MSVSPTPPSPVADRPAVLKAWSSPAQLTAAFLLGMATALLVYHAVSSWRWGSVPTKLDRRDASPFRIDLNRAERAELLQLPGVGESLARRILDYRQEHDGFQSVNELTKVHGIGPATLERLRPWVYVRSNDDGETQAALVRPTTMTSTPDASKTAGKKEANIKEPIDVNQADAETLQRLPGIGPKMAQRIIDERLKKPFKNVDDLRRVSGIGPKTLEKLRPFVIVKNDDTRVATTEP